MVALGQVFQLYNFAFRFLRIYTLVFQHGIQEQIDDGPKTTSLVAFATPRKQS